MNALPLANVMMATAWSGHATAMSGRGYSCSNLIVLALSIGGTILVCFGIYLKLLTLPS